MSNRIELKVDGMTCQGCVRSVEKKLSAIPGVESAHVDLAQGRATVTCDPSRATAEQMIAAVTQIGFQASAA